MVPGLALWLPSGYSLGAVLLLLVSLVSAPQWWRVRPSHGARWLAAAYLAMAALWLLDVGAQWGWGSMDRPAKYLLVLPCVFFLMAFVPRTQALWAGIAVGAMGAGVVAIYQVGVQQLERAHGFTNAIQFGNLSLLMAGMSAVLMLVQWARCTAWQRAGLFMAVALGTAGSLLSHSRGGWLALALLVPVCAWLLAGMLGRRKVYWGLWFLAVIAAGMLQLPAVEERVDSARHEVQQFQDTGNGRSSVGQRLAHWQLAWSMGWDKPLTGWGRAGYVAEKTRRVNAGEVDPFVLQFGHAHNEVLDLFAKRGLPGVLVLLLFYGVPLVLLWPTAARTRDAQGRIDRDSLSLCLVGVMLPLSYIGFGMTQVFLAHNSGNMFYLFMCPLVLAALQQRRAVLQRGSEP